MPPITRRIPTGTFVPYRTVRPATSKIIFLSLEGCVTEEEYFSAVTNLMSEIQSKIQFISVAEDAVQTIPKFRTPEQKRLLSKVRPKQLVERIDQFKMEKEDMYQFSKYPDDEFWIVTDVDKNWSNDVVSTTEGKTYLDEWNDAIIMCREKNYKYAISNPFFEIWLLLHHDEVTEEDRKFAVTDANSYQKTSHFRERLRELGVSLKDTKHINAVHYDVEKIKNAIVRAESLHVDKADMCPKYLATTVYMLLNKMIEMIPQDNV